MSKNKSPVIVDYAAGAAGFTTDIVTNASSSFSENEQVLNLSNGSQYCNRTILNKSVSKLITSAQLLSLNATPIEVIPTPGAGYINVVTSWLVVKPAGTAYAAIAGGDNLALKYTDASGAIGATVINSTGFLDQTTLQQRFANALAINGTSASAVGSFIPVTDAAIVLHLLNSEITTGNSPLYLLINYNIIPVDLVPTA